MHVYLIFPRTFEAIVFIICAYLLKIKDKKPNHPGYEIYKSLLSAFIIWIFYMIVDILVPIVAPLSFRTETLDFGALDAVTFMGYLTEYPSLFAANVMRDMQSVLAAIFIISTNKIAFITKYGCEKGLKMFKRKIRYIIYALSSLLIVLFDTTGVIIYENFSVETIYYFNNGAVLGMLTFLVVITKACGILIAEYIKGRDLLSDSERRLLKLFCLGYSFLAIGMWYWIIIPLIIPNHKRLIFQSIGHFVWSLAPVTLYMALKGKN